MTCEEWTWPIPPAATFCGHSSGEVMFGRCSACGTTVIPPDPICNERGVPESECPAYCLHADRPIIPPEATRVIPSEVTAP